MKYWQIIYKTGEKEFETRETIINDDQYKQVQKILGDGKPFIIMDDKPTIRSSSIVSINEADGIVNELIKTGTNKSFGIEPTINNKMISEPSQEKQREHIQEYLKNNKEKLYKKMGWSL